MGLSYIPLLNASLFLNVSLDLLADLVVQDDELKPAFALGVPDQLGIDVDGTVFLELKVQLKDLGGRVVGPYLDADAAFADIPPFGDDGFALDLKDVTGTGLNDLMDSDGVYEWGAGKFAPVFLF